ncbi:MAG TPA: DUF4232 domain-containing protein [Jatrophihabitans sp.]|nr:DUF4232 domain-containing protein [Jatrophihabitans sp.]
MQGIVLTRLVALGTTALLLAGCTQRSQPGAAASGPTGTGSGTTAPTSASAPSSISSPIPFSPPATSTSATSTAAPTPTATPKPSPSSVIEAGGCPTSALTVRALRGSGAAGHEFAFLQFTNSSASTCSLTGYPGVQLMVGGKPLGRPAARSGKPVRTVRIAPGTSVSAGLVDDSSCNAPISDSVQVYPPNRTDRLVLPLALRGCPLHIDPVSAG